MNRRRPIYAIIETGGKQYQVIPGQTIDVDYLDTNKGGIVELTRVLMVADGGNVTVGTPIVEGAKVLATSGGDGRGKKTIVLKYRSKSRYTKKTGHRQSYTRLTIDRIVAPGVAESGIAKKPRRRKKEAQDGA